jgi:LPS export ABC transporter protein LptC
LGKSFVFILSLAIFLVAGGVYLNRRWQEGPEAANHLVSDYPALSVKGLLVYSYELDHLSSRAIAGTTLYYAPERIEFDGRISMIRYLPGDRSESAFADKALVVLKESELVDIGDPLEVRRVDLMENVVMKVNDHVLRTPFAEYYPLEQEIRTDWNVEINGPGRVFEGDSGLRYNLASEELEIFGIVAGRELNTFKTE